MSTPNGQKVQILLEELSLAYGTTWSTTLINIMTNEQKKEWFLRLDPNGRIPVLIDNTQTPPFPVMETSAELLYLLKFADKEDRFGFTDELERNQCLQWMFFWHGSGAPYQGQVNHFSRAAPERIECLFPSSLPIHPSIHPFIHFLLLSSPFPDTWPTSQQTQSPASATRPSASTAC
jgi:glutathione S-transferase